MSTSVISDPQTYLHDSENSVIKLKLKKPKSWNFELSTSKSSPNINFPKILLYDHKNNLLAEADESNCIINDKKDNKLTNDKLSNSIITPSAATTNNVIETKIPPNTIINSNCNHNNIDPKQNNHHPVPLRNESCSTKSSHQSEIQTTSTTTPPSSLKYLGCRKRSLSGSFNEMKHFLNNFTSQLKSNGIDCKITNHHSSERRHPNGIGSTNEYKHLNENFNENQLRKIKSISDIHQATKGSKQNLPEPAVLIYNEKLYKKGPIQKHFKEKESTRMSSSSCRLISNFDEQKLTATKTVNGTDIFKNNVYLTGNQTTLNGINRNNFLLKKSKSSMEVVSGGADVQRNEKKKYRRAHSTSLRFSSSILERISEFKCRSSSTESEPFENQDNDSTENPSTKYFLRTSQAGTLVICNESFKNKKIRRRPKSYRKINENDEIDMGRAVTINDKIEFKKQSDNKAHNNGDDIYSNINRTYKGALQEENFDNFDKFSSRYENAIANIDDLIAKVVSSHRKESMNGKLKYKENISVNKNSCVCDEYRKENKLNKNGSAENLIKNTDNQLDKCINFSDSIGCKVVKEERKKRAKSLGKSGYLKNGYKNDSCESVQKFSKKYQCRSASVGSERYSSSSSSENENCCENTQRGRSRVKRRRTQEKTIKGEILRFFQYFGSVFEIKTFMKPVKFQIPNLCKMYIYIYIRNIHYPYPFIEENKQFDDR